MTFWSRSAPSSGGLTFDQVYPVGSIYLSMLATNPNVLLGSGVWARIAQGRGLWGQDGGDVDFDVAGDTGGAKTVTLGVPEIPAHSHGVTDPQHNHIQNQHLHAVTDPQHNHIQNQHLHAITDPNHNHTQNAHIHATLQVQGGVTAATTGTHIMTSVATGGSSRATTAPEQANTVTPTNVAAATGVTVQNTTPTNQAASTGISIQNTTPTNQAASTGITTQNAGGGGAHNNMPPWFTIYAWQRTA